MSMTKLLGTSRVSGPRTPVRYALATSPASDRRKKSSAGGVKLPVSSSLRSGIASRKEGSARLSTSTHVPFAEKGNLEMEARSTAGLYSN